jgi:hypothetical protein
VRKDCFAVSVAAHVLGDERQPARRSGSFRARPCGDCREHGRIIGVCELRWVWQFIEHVFEYSA